MNILIFNWDEKLINAFFGTGYNFFVCPTSIIGIINNSAAKSRFWNHESDLPSNAELIVDAYKLKELFTENKIDLICCLSKFDLETTYSFQIPKVFIPIFSVSQDITEDELTTKSAFFDMNSLHLEELTKNSTVVYINPEINDKNIGGYILDGISIQSKVTCKKTGHKFNLEIADEKVMAIEFKDIFASAAAKTKNPIVKSSKDTIVWEGPVFSHHSLALVNREIALPLIDKDKFNLFLNLGQEYNRVFKEIVYDESVNPRFSELRDKVADWPFLPDFYISHQWPPKFYPPPLFGHWIVFQPWEFGSLPIAWTESLKWLVDEAWVYSNDNRETFIRSGINKDKVHVISLGVNTDIFNMNAKPYEIPTKKKFKFIYIGGNTSRKGLDILLDSYIANFTKEDDVCLVIKDYAKPVYGGGKSLLENSINNANAQPSYPEIVYLGDNMTEEEIAGLLRACDCYVHPYRSEGFGLPIAEAMACGLPVIVTKHGACLDFCSDNTVYFIPAEIEYFKENKVPDPKGGFETVGRPFWAAPDKKETGRLMKHVYEHRDEAKLKGLKASEFISKNFTWKNTSEKIIDRLNKLKGTKIQRYLNSQISNFIEEGKFQFEQNNMEKAKFYFESVIADEPDNAGVIHSLGAIKFREKKYLEAFEYFYQSWEKGLVIADVASGISNILTEIGSVPLADKIRHLIRNHVKVWRPSSIWDIPIIENAFLENQSLNLNNFDMCIQSVSKEDDLDCKIQADMNIIRLTTDKYIELKENFIKNFYEIWTLTEQQKNFYEKQGIPKEKIMVVPLCIPLTAFSPDVMPADINGKRNFNFLYSGNFSEEEKFIYKMLDSYLKGFKVNDDVALILYLDSGKESFDYIGEKLSSHIEQNYSDPDDLPDIILLEQEKALNSIASVYAAANCIIVNGENPFADYRSIAAMAMKLNVVALNDKISDWNLTLNKTSNDKNEALIEQRYKIVFENHNLSYITKIMTGYLNDKLFIDLFKESKQNIMDYMKNKK